MPRLRRRIMRWSEVQNRVQKSASTVYREEREGKFPRRVKLGVNSVGWFEDEVDAYLEGLERGFVNPPAEALAARERQVEGLAELR